MDRRIYPAVLGLLCLWAGLARGATHTIEKGDTLYSLSRTLGVSVNALEQANPGLDAKSLQVGSVIQVPETPKPAATEEPDQSNPDADPAGEPPKTAKPSPADFYVVEKGDTLSSISRQSGVSVADLRRLNKLGGNTLKVKQRLRLREGGTDGAAGTDDEGPVAVKVRKPKEVEPEYLFVSKAKAKIDAPKLGSREWRYIVVHHSGTNSGSAKIFEYYHRHVRGMENGMAYHFVIGNGSDSGDGEIEVGGRWLKQLQGGHLRSDEQNEVAIGICLVGDFNENHPTRKQIAALIELITYLEKKIGKPRPKFALHRDINIRPTDCPGKYFPAQAMYKLFGAWEG